MKKPTEHQPSSAGCYEDEEACTECSQPWPCKTWRRWTRSKDYRIAELEAAVKRLAGRAGDQERQLHRLEKTVRDDSSILRNGILHAVQDVGMHGRTGNLSLDWVRDWDDLTMAGSDHVTRPAELTVIYKDVDGRTWTNGIVTEQNHPPGG